MSEPTPIRVVADTAKTRSEEAARVLAELLARAQAGELTDICYIAVRNDNYEIGRTVSMVEAIGQSAMLHYRFMKQMERP